MNLAEWNEDKELIKKYIETPKRKPQFWVTQVNNRMKWRLKTHNEKRSFEWLK